MSDASKQSWTKPTAMAIPKGGFFKDKEEQGRYGPIFPKSRLLNSRESHPRKGRTLLRVRQKHRAGCRGPARLSGCAQTALPALGALPNQRGYLFHVSGHLRYGF